MCRWQTYCGPAIYMDQLIYEPEHSLIDQSMQANESKSAINADGVGVGWYGERKEPGLYRQIQPAWNDTNLRNLAHHVRSNLFFAHIRASTGSTVSIPNCHPFIVDNWMFMHNGMINDFSKIRRAVEARIPDNVYTHRIGTTDSEALFLMMFANGLEQNPAKAFSDTMKQIEEIQRDHGLKPNIAVTAIVTNGEQITAVRYATSRMPPSLYLDDGAERLIIVSEPFTDDGDRWTEVPPSHVVHATRCNIESIEPLA